MARLKRLRKLYCKFGRCCIQKVDPKSFIGTNVAKVILYILLRRRRRRRRSSGNDTALRRRTFFEDGMRPRQFRQT